MEIQADHQVATPTGQSTIDSSDPQACAPNQVSRLARAGLLAQLAWQHGDVRILIWRRYLVGQGEDVKPTCLTSGAKDELRLANTTGPRAENR